MTKDEIADEVIGKARASDRDIHVHVGGGAYMSVPKNEWLWQMTHVRPEPARGTKCDDRMLAVSSLESYLYLLNSCLKEEAWRRIKILRAAIIAQQEPRS